MGGGGACLRVVDDLKSFAFLERQIGSSAGLIVVECHKGCDTSCGTGNVNGQERGMLEIHIQKVEPSHGQLYQDKGLLFQAH